MKCVILCGGKGTRLREETEFIPKPLVEIGGHPILWHIMKIYYSFGVKDFILTLGYKGDMIKRYFFEYSWQNKDVQLNLKENKIKLLDSQNMIEDWDITFAETGIETLTGRRLFLVKKYLQNEENFCLTYGDGVAKINIDKLYKYHLKHGKMITLTAPHPHSKYGVLSLNSTNEVLNFQEKPVMKDHINGGFMIINQRFFDILTDENIPIESVIANQCVQHEVMMFPLEDFWFGMDTYKDYEDLNKIWHDSHIWKLW